MKKGLLASITAITGAVAGAAAAEHIKGKDVAKYKELADKHLAIMLMYNQWMTTKQQGKSIITYFKENGYKEIAIYGMSYVGERVLEELKDSEINVKYAIDKKADSIYMDIEVITPDDVFDDVDVIVVTSNYYFDAIEEMLMEKVDCPIINFEDILYEI